MFRVSQHPSSGVLKTVTATSSAGHNTGPATSLQRGLIRPCWREVAVPEAAVTGYLRCRYSYFRRPRWREVAVPEAAVTVFSTPVDGCCDTRNM